MIQQMPKLPVHDPDQCLNCGKVITEDRIMMCSKPDRLFLCKECYEGYKAYLAERQHLIKDGNVILLKALDKGTALEYENLIRFVDTKTL